MERVPIAKNFIGSVKEMINFIRESPKRLAQFKNLQSEDSPALMQFCPTRWYVRVKSLKTLEKRSNYEAAQSFFEELQMTQHLTAAFMQRLLDSKQLESFEFYFMLNFMIAIFDRIEILNASLQKSNLNVHEAHGKVQAVMKVFVQTREKSFETVWNEATTNANNLGLKEPKLPRIRKI
ncbi:zinc finger MYM-type protein 1-like [Solenopsis invicta]|uniref:zinc finger MYM-type protein 1-like n=1 Tax=Solenopsis invicta TaxID=13686 RepID=UPI00193D5020|nr:zinc finger MYM-type protein 1-like [Solenopsis invicta]